jgi:carboxylate-amine ligase
VLAAFHKAARARLKVAEREIIESQVEVSNPPLTSFSEAAGTLGALRSGLAEIGGEHGIKVFEAGTHPIARWSRQSHTKKERYARLIQQLQIIGRRTIVCGMHVHVEVPRPETRVDLMNRLLPTMPLLLALSVSSPFWQGQQTGMAGYRMSARCTYRAAVTIGWRRGLRTLCQYHDPGGCDAAAAVVDWLAETTAAAGS